MSLLLEAIQRIVYLEAHGELSAEEGEVEGRCEEENR